MTQAFWDLKVEYKIAFTPCIILLVVSEDNIHTLEHSVSKLYINSRLLVRSVLFVNYIV